MRLSARAPLEAAPIPCVLGRSLTDTDSVRAERRSRNAISAAARAARSRDYLGVRAGHVDGHSRELGDAGHEA